MEADVLKVDTHRHLGGCIGPDFVWETVQKQSLHYLAESYGEVAEQMTFGPDEPPGFHRFLDKFKILDHIKWDEQTIDRSIELVCKDLVDEGIDYCWMDFSINKYMEHMKWHRKDAIRFVHDSFRRWAPGRVGLMLSLKYEATRASQRQYAHLIDEPGVAESLIGIDLVGDEQYFDADFYAPLFRDWQEAGKITRAHVAESQPAVNFVRAVRRMRIRDVAHGIKIWDNRDHLAMAADYGVCFHLALTSNYLTGVWSDLHTHPIRALFNADLDVTIGTDDPVQCGIGLDDEFELLGRLGFDERERRLVALNATGRSAEYGLIGRTT